MRTRRLKKNLDYELLSEIGRVVIGWLGFIAFIAVLLTVCYFFKGLV